MSITSIEWTDVTWNPTRGCSRVSEGCRNCYAERIAARFSKPGETFHGFARVVAPRDTLDRVGGRRAGWTGRVELIPSKLDEPLRWRKPRRVFVNSMSDLFHEALPDEAIDRVFAVMALAQEHAFQVLTKRPERTRAYLGAVHRTAAIAYRLGETAMPFGSPEGGLLQRAGIVAEQWTSGRLWPLPNVWLGVSVEDQATADERIPLLLQTPAAVRFVSYEPALGPVDFRTIAPWDDFHTDALDTPDPSRRLDWVIVGGESGPGARPFDVAWARSVVRQCREAGVACFVKQLGARPHAYSNDSSGRLGNARRGRPFEAQLRSAKGGDPSEWPEDLRVREFPS